MSFNNTLFITSIGPGLLEEYGKETLQTVFKNIPFPITVFFDKGCDFSDLEIPENVTFQLLDDDELMSFRKETKKTSKRKFRQNAFKFAPKVFSIRKGYDFALKNNYDYLIWLDVDVYVKNKISDKDISAWFKNDTNIDISWLDRPHFSHGETGFLGLKVKSEQTNTFVSILYNCYINRTLFMMKEHHDAFVTTFIIRNLPKDTIVDLNSSTKGTEAFQNSILKNHMRHIK